MLKQMLSKLRVQHYKSLFDTEVDLEPLTVFIGPNGSGKSNISEALSIFSNFLKNLISAGHTNILPFFSESLLKAQMNNQQSIKSKFWHGELDFFVFKVSTLYTTENIDCEKSNIFSDISVNLDFEGEVCTISIPKIGTLKSEYTSNFKHFLISHIAVLG